MTLPDELAVFLHDSMCFNSPDTGTCSRWQREGSPHKDFYELMAQHLISALEPQVGLERVLPVVKSVVEEIL